MSQATRKWLYSFSLFFLLLPEARDFLKYHKSFLLGAKQICDNIDHKVAWFWPMEHVLACHYREYIGVPLLDLYNNIKTYFGLTKFPVLTEQQLLDFCHKFYVGNFRECDFSINNRTLRG